MAADCGTSYGYTKHVKERTPKCAPCREARRIKMQEWRKATYLNRGNLIMDATGVRRRLQALAAIGWSAPALHKAGVGLANCTIHQFQEYRDLTTLRSTHEKVKAFYEENSMITPESTPWVIRTVIMATKKGWAPPFAWDDDTMDDPHVIPAGLKGTEAERRWWGQANLLERVCWVEQRGWTNVKNSKRLFH